MGLFDGVQNFTPAFTGRQLAIESGRSAANALLGGMQIKNQRDRINLDRKMLDAQAAERDRQAEAEARARAKAQRVSQLFGNARDLSSVFDVISKNPHIMADPDTQPLVRGIIDVQTRIEDARQNTLLGKSRLDDLNEFNKRLSGLLPEDRAAIRGMTRLEDGSASPEQWQALSLAEETMMVREDNRRKQAELEAIQSGAEVETTIDEKGVTKRFKPATATKSNTPMTMKLDDGTTLAWMPSGNSIHVIRGNRENLMTPGQLADYAKSLRETPDSDSAVKLAEKIDSFLANKIEGQIGTKEIKVKEGVTIKKDPLNLFGNE